MSIKLEKLQRRDPITTHLPIPSSEELKERYRRIQNEMEKKKLRSLHSFAREWISDLLDQMEAALEKAS